MVDIIAELHIGADILLAYFHYCCKGFRPFSLDWNAAETTLMAEVDVDQIRFIKNTATYVKTNGKRPILAFYTRSSNVLIRAEFSRNPGATPVRGRTLFHCSTLRRSLDAKGYKRIAVVELGAISVPAISLNLATSSNQFISAGPVGQIGGEESGDMLVVACVPDASVACKTGHCGRHYLSHCPPLSGLSKRRMIISSLTLRLVGS